ncbi:GldG family protein [Candidatus Falkowbacteria bacterium]|nr:GldG family protein [Candidatus Falkowbacteria bacterium]
MKINSKFLNKINSTALILIIIGILIVLNFFSYNIFYRFDLTQNKDYSLSKASKLTAAGLKDIVSIKAYFSADLPSQFLNLRQEVGDILDEYASYSGGKIKIEFIDPKDDEATQQELYSAGIPELQFNALEKDKYQVINGYLGMLIKYGEKFQAIPVIQNTKDLEYQITSAIKKLTSIKVPNIGFWQGNGAAGAETGVSAAYNKLGEIYNVSSVDYAVNKKIADDLDILVIIGPKEKFKDDELKAIDAFLMGGGSLVILADGIKVEQGLVSSKNDTGLNKILEPYGVKLNQNLVLDVNNGVASFSQGFVNFTVNYPYWPKVIKSGFDQNNPAVARLESLVLPWASAIDIAPEKIKDAAVSYLAVTSDQAMAVADNFKLQPQAEISGGARGKFNLAVSLSGKFMSLFNEPSSKAGRLILVADSDFIMDNFLQNYPDNLVFFQNIIDGLSLGNDLISIRSKGVTERPIKEISESAKAAVRYANIFGLTIIVVLFGVIRYFLRRKARFEDQL